MALEFTRSLTIKASPEKVWEAITDPAVVGTYHLAPLKIIELSEGGEILFGTKKRDFIRGEILRVEAEAYLEHSFQFSPGQEGVENDAATTVIYLLEAEGEGTRLTLRHTGFEEENQTYANIMSGWPYILEGLKGVAERL